MSVLINWVKKYNNTHHETFRMMFVDVKSKMYINFNKDNNYKDFKFKVDDCVRVLKYKNIFAKGYAPKWSKKFLCLRKKLKIMCHGQILIEKELLEIFKKESYKK